MEINDTGESSVKQTLNHIKSLRKKKIMKNSFPPLRFEKRAVKRI
jgi:hypothetical protein